MAKKAVSADERALFTGISPIGKKANNPVSCQEKPLELRCLGQNKIFLILFVLQQATEMVSKPDGTQRNMGKWDNLAK